MFVDRMEELLRGRFAGSGKERVDKREKCGEVRKGRSTEIKELEDGEKVRGGGGGKERSGEDGEGRGRRRKVLEMFGNNGGVVERKMYKSGGDHRGREGEE